MVMVASEPNSFCNADSILKVCMTIYDVFNGDADGICALIQLLLAEPCDTTLVIGVKLDI
jgi:hypothetical protein